MTSVLGPFTPLATCAKCGHDRVRTIYRDSGRHASCVTASRLRTNRIPEHLERACERCDFRWEELCVDEAVEPKSVETAS